MQIRLLPLLLLGAALSARAQYVPPSPPGPVPGALDAWLQAADPALKGWDFGVNERARAEDKVGAGTTHAGSNFDFDFTPPSSTSNSYWISRLMPRAGYTGDWLALAVEGRSSYSVHDDRFNAAAAGHGLSDNDGPLQLQQAYVALGNLKQFPLLLKVGRQELTYGDQRLVGSAFWLNIPHAFDAVKVRYQNPFMGIEVFAANLVYARNGGADRSNSQDTLSGIYADFPGLSKTSVAEAYVFARNVARGIVTDNWSEVPAPFRFTAPQDIYTPGVHFKSRPGALGPWDYGIELMDQFGNRTAVFAGSTVAAGLAAPRLAQSAWAYVLQAGYTWKDDPLKPRLAFIASGASGDGNSADAKSSTFQNLLPSNHGLYGIMDLSGLQNLRDYRLSLSTKPSPATSLALEAHQQYLWTTHDFWYNAASVPRNTPGAAPGSGRGFGLNPSYSPDLGQEVDAIAGWAPAKGLLLEAGAGHFFRGQYIQESLAAVGSKDANYGYLQVTINL